MLKVQKQTRSYFKLRLVAWFRFINVIRVYYTIIIIHNYRIVYYYIFFLYIYVIWSTFLFHLVSSYNVYLNLSCLVTFPSSEYLIKTFSYYQYLVFFFFFGAPELVYYDNLIIWLKCLWTILFLVDGWYYWMNIG